MGELSAIGRISMSSGTQKPGWFYLSIDDDFSRYYAWFCRNRGSWDLPMNGCHMTFIAGEKEERLIGLDEIARYLDEDVEFFYEPQVMTEGRSFWIDARCPRLDQIRKELALPCKWRGYHVTLGNLKNRQPRR
jgi:hypothetical protein